MKPELIELVEAYGWSSIPSKNPYMISFLKEETKERMNVYKTGTITVQNLEQECKTYRDIYDINKLEEILIKHK